MTIRLWNSSDRDKLLHIKQQSVKHTCNSIYTSEEIAKRLAYLDSHENPLDNHTVLLSCIREDIVWFISFSISDTTAQIENLYVLPEFQEKWIAHELIDKMEDIINDEKIDKISVRSTLNAQTFYEKLWYSFVQSTASKAWLTISILEKTISL